MSCGAERGGGEGIARAVVIATALALGFLALFAYIVSHRPPEKAFLMIIGYLHAGAAVGVIWRRYQMPLCAVSSWLLMVSVLAVAFAIAGYTLPQAVRLPNPLVKALWTIPGLALGLLRPWHPLIRRLRRPR
jgi:hypothetical protein